MSKKELNEFDVDRQQRIKMIEIRVREWHQAERTTNKKRE